MKLVVGLGNPGKKYEATKHNVGFMTADLLAEELKTTFAEKKKHNCMLAESTMLSDKLLIAKPLTFMNSSGETVRSLMDYYNIAVEDIIIIVDDLTLDAGVLRIRPKGSSGGQNGIKSIIEHIGTKDFIRIKLGIGKPEYGAIDHVLGGFSDEDWENMKKAISRAVKAVPEIFAEGAVMAMNKFNG